MTQFILVYRFLSFGAIFFFYPGDGSKGAVRNTAVYVPNLASIYQGNLHISEDRIFDIRRRDA
jgi:hypothetical protein